MCIKRFSVMLALTMMAGGVSACSDTLVVPPNVLYVVGQAPSCGLDGGHTISMGHDTNMDGVLQFTEADDTLTVCNGQNGLPGPSGTNGSTGATGADGADGADGEDAPPVLFSSRAATLAECANGGTVVSAGQDTNLNDTLDTNEIQQNFLTCNGLDGGDGENGSITFTHILSCNGNSLFGKAVSFLALTISSGEVLATANFDGAQKTILNNDNTITVVVEDGSTDYTFQADTEFGWAKVKKDSGSFTSLSCSSFPD